ncbi:MULTISPECIES: GNAT family N-acetyltransferase [unclassified Streptomyces]|uniref:GNAT family N-acetyltransferase n=1 Tax=unclassified Streptomyces TaxID=2593676 RepID=UPI0004CC000E|nr:MULTISPECIES: GNAT family N-acetyltransferase [unclassified Streptomyces]MDX3772304.1 GNAT family N-acetyltransferase [Streptomyces sp. AK08-01B]MDX3821701.1 GNAT family N-acetyltransferase [Streptomyces sp. AK08-01A]
MTWFMTDKPEVFRSEAGAFLVARPDLHTMLLSGLDTIEYLRSGGEAPPTVLGWWREGDEAATTAAFVWMPPHLLTASRLSQVAATNLARRLSTQAHAFTQLLADDASVCAFSKAWETTTGFAPKSGPHLRLYRLQQLVRPGVAPPGAPRTATDGDRTLLHDWCTRFVTEAGSIGADLDAFIDERISRGGWRLWTVGDEPVAMAAMTSVIAGTARLTPIYTLPEQRGRGYGSAVTAAVSQAAEEAGAEHVLLFTDLATPTSNSVYQRIGYRPVTDYRIVAPSHR